MEEGVIPEEAKFPAPRWARGLEAVRRRTQYRLRLGPRLGGAVSRHLTGWLEVEVVRGIQADLDLGQVVERDTWLAGISYEQPTPEMLRSWLRGADRFFDIGANYGWFSYFALAESTADVYPFEPHPRLIARMEHVKTANHLTRLHPQQLAVGRRSETLHMHLLDTQTCWSTFADVPDMVGDPGTPVQVVNFDEWLASEGIDHPSDPTWVAKLDVEGFELQALEGMADSLQQQAFRGLAVELNAHTLQYCGTSPQAVIDFLKGVGYQQLPAPGHQQMLNSFFVPGD